MDQPHVVEVPCNCGDLEHCRMNPYVSDVRIAYEHNERLIRAIYELLTQRVQARIYASAMATR